jgi:diguanylate cyclase (GGDEF)-like protein
VNPEELLDAEVRMEGVAGGIFDGKFQRTGAELWMSTAKHMEVLKPSPGRVTNLPLTPISAVLSDSYVKDESRRVHVQGSVTFYQPGLQMVVETPRRNAVLVKTYTQSPLRMGQVVDVLGYPDMGQNSEAITEATVLPQPKVEAIRPVAVQWEEAMSGKHPYDLVSMEGTVAAQIHEEHQDTLVIRTGTHAFSAVLRRTVWNRDFDRLTLPRYGIGSRVRVSGVCFVHSGGPWNTPLWFELEMNSPADVQVLAAAPWWNVQHLLYLSAALVLLMLGALLWVMALKRKVRRQAEQMRLRGESEAARERRIALLEKERGKVLESINAMQDLDAVLRMIVHLIESQLEGQACWCELAGGKRLGETAGKDTSTLLVRREILSGAGERLGTLVVAGGEVYHIHAGEVMEMGASLIALAIDRNRMYETLVHRSQYDQLTNAANRFLLESRLDEALAQAERTKSRCGLVYVDLDHFKQINDEYGHRAGDLVLQQVTQRFSEKLRGMDTLARVGGDEFIALVPVVRSRAEVEEIAQRLVRCFDEPFEADGQRIAGAGSVGIAIYPDDGLTKDELKRVADTEMYVRKANAVR